MNFKFPNQITYKQFWNIYSKSFLFLEISFLILQLLSWKYPRNNYGKISKPCNVDDLQIGRKYFPDIPYKELGQNLIGIYILIAILVFMPFLYTLIRRRVRDMEIDPFFKFIFYVPSLTISIAGITVMFKSFEVF